MRRILMAGAALALIGATAAHADERDREAAGGAAGGVFGAAAGAAVGGPVGAVVGGIAGMAIGAETAVPDDARVYVIENPTPPVVMGGQISADTRFDDSVVLTPIPNHPDLAYVYVRGGANKSQWINVGFAVKCGVSAEEGGPLKAGLEEN